MSDSIITIEAQDMPTKAFSIALEEPNFKVRKQAAQLMPSNPDSNPGFTLEQAMIALSIREISGKPVQQKVKDPLDVIKNFMPKDLQFLLSYFVSAFTLTDDLADDAKRLAKSMLEQPIPSFVIPKEDMPTESFSVTFRRPTINDEMVVNRLFPGAQAQPGFTREEMLMTYCITHVDGKPVTQTKAIIDLIDDWYHIDTQFLFGVFLNVAYLEPEDRSRAVEMGKQLRKRKRKSDGSSTKSTKKASTPAVTSKDAPTPAG